MLPVYLGLFLGAEAAALIRAGPFIDAFLWLIVVPLALAWLTQCWSSRSRLGEKAEEAMSWLPVPLMVVLLIVFAAVAADIGAAAGDVARAVPI